MPARRSSEEYLGKSGFHSEHWSNVGSAQAVDAEIMAFAADHDYGVLTNDLDFSAILAVTHRRKPSVLQIRSRILDYVAFLNCAATSCRQPQARRTSARAVAAGRLIRPFFRLRRRT
jgi:predicted nuclease of predicted toxin-antitoxin system